MNIVYNEVDSDLQPFNSIDSEEIFLFSGGKTSSMGTTFLQEDDDEHLRHQPNVGVSGSSPPHLHVDELLLSASNLYTEPTTCGVQHEDAYFWGCKDISEDQINEVLQHAAETNNNLSNTISNAIHSISNINNLNNNISTSVINNNNILSQHPSELHNNLSTPNIVTTSTTPNSTDQHMQTATGPTQQHLHLQNQIQQQHHHHHIHQIIGPIQQQVLHLQQSQPQQQQHLQIHQDPHQQILQPQHLTIQDQQQQPYQAQTQILNVSQQRTQPQTQQQQTQQQLSLPVQIVPFASQPQYIEVEHQPQEQQQPITSTQQSFHPPQIQIVSPLIESVDKNQNHIVSYLSDQGTQIIFKETTCETDEQNSQEAKQNSANRKLSSKVKIKEKQTRLDCPYCQRSFCKNFDLQQHMRCHTGEKPFQCIVCGRGFAQKSNVKKHMQAHKVWPEGPSQSSPQIHSSVRSRNNSACSSVGTKDDEYVQENESSMILDNDNIIKSGVALSINGNNKDEVGDNFFVDSKYSCAYCSFNGRTYFELKSHLTIHKREKVFKCIVSSCGKIFAGNDLQNFLDHVKNHKNELTYHCHLCSSQFTSLHEFGLHQKSHNNTQVKKEANALTNVNQSNGTNIKTQSVTKNQAPMNQQQSQTHNQTQLQQPQQQQQQQQHSRQMSQLSHQLQQISNNKQESDQHAQQLIGAQQTKLILVATKQEDEVEHHQHQQEAQLLQQQQQQKSSSNNPSKTGQQKYFRCSKCMNRYTTQTALDHHLSISSHHFPCTECDKVFPCERYLRRHLNTHTTNIHVCSYCDKQFKTAAYLKMHSVVHTGEKPFRCNQCDAAFNRRDKLNRHKLTHEPVKKFKCPFKPHIGCTKEFNRPDKLKAHLLTHSGIRPHPCDTCSRTFSRLSRLREHKRLHHSVQSNIDNNLTQA